MNLSFIQTRFKLPSRLIAKTFVFRLIYGGSAYSYANDPNFTEVSKSEKFWQRVIDEFYEKYNGIYRWHNTLMQETMGTGRLVLPTGRTFKYQPTEKRGEMVWPRTTILNYPVQGLGADLMTIVRVSLFNRIKKLNLTNCKFVNTVHDSIIIDTIEENAAVIIDAMYAVFEDLPKNFERLFGVEWNVPMACEIEIGTDWGNMNKVVDRAI